MSEKQPLANRWTRQILGMLAGAGAALVLAGFFPAFAQEFGLVRLLLWSGILGSILFSLRDFERAGGVLTRKDNRVINTLVGLALPAGLLVLWVLLTER